jgi:hypothetical protein
MPAQGPMNEASGRKCRGNNCGDEVNQLSRTHVKVNYDPVQAGGAKEKHIVRIKGALWEGHAMQRVMQE